MVRKKEKSKDSQFVCANTSCRLVFSKPLKVKNLMVTDSKLYEACPRCLTAITSIEENLASEPEQVQSEAFPKTEEPASIAEPKDTSPSGAQCAHHLGYLSERAKNEKIPDDCMICENIVKCMLKNVSG